MFPKSSSIESSQSDNPLANRNSASVERPVPLATEINTRNAKSTLSI